MCSSGTALEINKLIQDIENVRGYTLDNHYIKSISKDHIDMGVRENIIRCFKVLSNKVFA